MDLDEIKEILDMMREHDLAEFELERDGVKLRLRKQSSGTWTAATPAQQGLMMTPAPAASSGPGGGPAAGPAVSVLTGADDEDVDLAIVKSPIVGTFYRAADPGAKPFVETGQVVKKGQPLCIIEAMKLMNEINAECDGELVKVFVENGNAEQSGERLFALTPS